MEGTSATRDSSEGAMPVDVQGGVVLDTVAEEAGQETIRGDR